MKQTTLQKAAWEARQAHANMLAEIREERDRWLKKCASEFDANIAEKFSTKISELSEAACAAEQAELAEREQLATKDLPYPVGTKLCGWKNQSQGWGMDKNPRWALEVHGIMEICTRETVHPAGLANYSRAPVGTVLVRLLKKDGTPSLKYEKWGNSWRSHTWLPEGKKPKGAS